MRDETAAWLDPLCAEAQARGIDPAPLLAQTRYPAAEADDGLLDHLGTHRVFADPRVQLWAVDWVRFGQLLRHELGWDVADPAQSRPTPYPSEPPADAS